MKYLIPIIFCIYSNISFSQIFLVSFPSQNQAFVGLENPLEVFIADSLKERTIIVSDNGTIIKNNELFYIYTPKRIGKSLIKLCQINNQDTIIIDKKSIEVRDFPKPKFMVCGKDGGSINAKVLKKSNCIRISYTEFDIDINITNITYSVCIFRNSKPLANKQNLKINENAIFDLLEHNDKILFYNVSVQIDGLGTVKLLPVEIDVF